MTDMTDIPQTLENPVDQEPDKKRRPPIEIDDTVARGTYANALAAAHTSNDFILDFIFVSPSGRSVVSRIIIAPERMKALHVTMADSIKKYEEKYGAITKREKNN